MPDEKSAEYHEENQEVNGSYHCGPHHKADDRLDSQRNTQGDQPVQDCIKVNIGNILFFLGDVLQEFYPVFICCCCHLLMIKLCDIPVQGMVICPGFILLIINIVFGASATYKTFVLWPVIYKDKWWNRYCHRMKLEWH